MVDVLRAVDNFVLSSCVKSRRRVCRRHVLFPAEELTRDDPWMTRDDGHFLSGTSSRLFPVRASHLRRYTGLGEKVELFIKD